MHQPTEQCSMWNIWARPVWREWVRNGPVLAHLCSVNWCRVFVTEGSQCQICIRWFSGLLHRLLWLLTPELWKCGLPFNGADLKAWRLRRRFNLILSIIKTLIWYLHRFRKYFHSTIFFYTAKAVAKWVFPMNDNVSEEVLNTLTDKNETSFKGSLSHMSGQNFIVMGLQQKLLKKWWGKSQQTWMPPLGSRDWVVLQNELSLQFV